MFSTLSLPRPLARGSASAYSRPSQNDCRLFLFTPTPLQLTLATSDRPALAALLQVEIAEDWPVFAESLEYASQSLADPENLGWNCWFGVEVASRRLVAVGGFHRPPGADGEVEFGYALAKEARGRGLGTEFAATLLRYALCDPRVRCVLAHTMADGVLSPEGFDNLASTAILRRLGFVHEGEDQGEWRWRLDRSRLQSRRRSAG